LGALLASADAVALDRVACALAGLDWERLVVVREAARRGVGEADLSRIKWVGVPASHWSGMRFQPPPGSGVESGLAARLMRSPFLKNRFLDRPRLDAQKCGGCQKCKEICPAGAIALTGEPGKPKFALGPCIRCFCCAEVCPEGAIHKSAAPLLGRLLGGRT
jgi:Pyruvate/2-oxoacid:ferredoxin oxidoreductase delta subunit